MNCETMTLSKSKKATYEPNNEPRKLVNQRDAVELGSEKNINTQHKTSTCIYIYIYITMIITEQQ